MDKQTYDTQALYAYLLGSLSADEAERFDELSFTDDRFADELAAAEKDLVDAYARGELAGATLEKFKSHYLASPLRREKVEFARAFQVFAEKSAAAQTGTEEISSAVEDKPKRGLGGFFSELFAVPRLSLQWGLAAATLAFLFFGGWLLLENSRLRREMDVAEMRRTELQQREAELQNEISRERYAGSEKEAELARVRAEIARLEQEQEQERRRINELERKRAAERQQAGAQKQPSAPSGQISIASFILAPQMRGSNQIPTLSIPENTDAAAMRLELEPNDYAAFRVALVSQADNRVLWRSGALKARGAGESKSLNVRFPAGLLKSSQSYSLEVSGIGAKGEAEIISNYPFRAVLK